MKALADPLLAQRAPRHGFGQRDFPEPGGLRRPRQVHGATVIRAESWDPAGPAPEADGVVAQTPGLAVGVVTADCVPLLLASRDGRVVAALHAGWRGLARGVVEAGVAALAGASGEAPASLVAAIGPHIGPCCYEVDEPVLAALETAYGEAARQASRSRRAGHAMLDLGALARRALRDAGLPAAAVGEAAVRCTACDPARFHSYRRDGARAGRLVHFVTVREG